MSRCLPYNQNGATIEALINPIKLQKEKSEKSKAKAERKEEKRAKKEQKQIEKEKRKDEEKRTVPKSLTVDSTKALIKNSVLTKTSELTIEQRERSDLTEEHGQPIRSQQPSYSSDSTQNTQNSNKRKRDDTVLPDGSGGNGKQIKIRLLKKPRGPEPGVDPSLSNVGRVKTPVRALNSVQVPGVAGRNLVASNGRTSVPTTSGRENVAPQARRSSQTMSGSSSELSRMQVNELQKQRVGMKQTAPSSVRPVPPKHLKHEVPNSQFNKTEVLPVLSQSRQNDVKLGQFGRQQLPTSSRGRPPVLQGCLVNDVPSSSLDVPNAPSVTRRIDVQGPRSGGQQVAPSSGTVAVPRSHLEREIPRPSLNVQTGPTVSRRNDVQGPRFVGQQQTVIPKMPTSQLPHANTSNASVLGKRSIAEVTPYINAPARSEMGVSLSGVPQKVGPTGSVKGKEFAVSEVPQKATPTRLEKKMMKKISKYEELIGSWVPPVMAPCGGGCEDEDWLSKKSKTVKSCSKDVGTRELATPSLWQPCARFLVEADVYALPYTVPF